ncbi:MAG: ATP-binding cassette domain-containing protein [Caldilineaceae bacterium]|nr:ATP-binding cassette domain-containing protein [Caldilineaceae bacterium]
MPLSACVTKGDRVRVEAGDVWVIGKNGDCKILQPYIVPDMVNLGGVKLEVLVKEVTEDEEHIGYQALADYHYRGKVIHGRTARLIVRTFHPKYPKVLGYIELATPFFMNKPRSRVMDAPFACGPVAWDSWDMTALRKYIHVVVRIARTVVAPEFRGANIGQLMVKHAASFARSRWQVSGYLPYFLEISADMLKFVPFAERAGMTYVGETEGNLKRVAKDMRYLIGRFREDPRGKMEFENISGILDKQVDRMDRSIEIMEQEGIDVDALYQKLDSLSQRSVLKQFALFHGIVSLPKPHYMAGLSEDSAKFLADRVEALSISNGHVPPKFEIEAIAQPIVLDDITIEYSSSVRRTYQTHAVQQAFDISPDHVLTTVIKNLSVTVEPGSIVLVLGPSGSGKTSLLQLLSNSPGRRNALARGKVSIPYNFRPETFRDFRSRKPLVDALGEKDVRSALYLLGLAGLSEPTLYLKRFQELSRGQQYRAMLSRLIASRSNVWIADEFCANLDPATANIVADNVQRIARRLGVTVVAAAPHCDTFLHSLRPDVVVRLGSSWDHSTIPGEDYLRAVGLPTDFAGEIPRIYVESELLKEMKTGAKNATVWKGRRHVRPGLTVVSDGRESIAVRVKSSVCKRFSHLSDEDAEAESLEHSGALKSKVKEVFPDLQERSLVTVIRFEHLLNAWFPISVNYSKAQERA